MSTATAPSATSIEVVPTGAFLGAEVRCGDVRALGDAEYAEIRRAALDHLVIVIRGQQLTAMGLEPVGNPSAQFAAALKEEIARWANVAKRAGIRTQG